MRFAAAALALLAGTAHAGLAQLRFEVKSDLCGSPVPFAELPSRTYAFTVDLARQGERRDPDGSTYVMPDGPSLEVFYAELAAGNYVQPSTLDPTGPIYNFGLWFNQAGQNIWCSPQVNGSFNYATIATIGVGHRDDQVTATGMWANSVPFTGIESFLTPGALWIIGDNGKNPTDYIRNGSYVAELVSIEAVPEPGTLVLGLSALVALLWGKRRAIAA